MTEYSVPATFTIGEDENATDIIYKIAESNPAKTVFRRKEGSQWVPVRADEAVAQVTAIAKGLIASGLEPGDRVALLSRTRLEWILFDFAIWAAGGITVPIYDSSSGPQIDWIMQDSGAKIMVLEDAAHRKIYDGIEGLSDDIKVFQIDAADNAAVATLTTAGADIADDDVTVRRATRGSADTAICIYTSGTTGRPKGCELTHANLLSEIRAVEETGLLDDIRTRGGRLLMFLPMAHVFAHAITLVAIEIGGEVGFTSDIPNLVPELAVFQPSLLLSVPRVFEKVFNSAQQKAHDEGKGKIFDAAADTAIAYSKATEAGNVGLILKAKHAVFDALVYKKLRAALGGKAEFAISGGAALGARLGHFFSGVGIPVFEGYGLTETTAAFGVNLPTASKIGSVGKPLPGNSVRVASDGEILLSGGVVFKGYWRNEEATAAALQDGWFHTGDLGNVDSNGFVSITGRKKELIVTAGGKNVSPAGLEDVIRGNPIVSQAMVVGDAKPFVAAIVTIDPEAFPAWKERNGKAADASVADLVNDDTLRAEIQTSIDKANTTVSHAEQIKKFRILPSDFSEETGEMTPTLKVKRNVVADKFSTDIEALYSK